MKRRDDMIVVVFAIELSPAEVLAIKVDLDQPARADPDGAAA
jgi:hypothetical protein